MNKRPEPHRFEKRDDDHDACRHCGEPEEEHPVFDYDPATNAWLRRLDSPTGGTA